MKRFLVASLALAMLTGCGAQAPVSAVRAAKEAPVQSNAWSKEIQDRMDRGEIQWLYGTFFKGTVTRVETRKGVRVFLAKAGSGSQVRGTGVFAAHGRKGLAALKAGDKVSLFVNYPLIEVKTQTLVDTGEPYWVMSRPL